MSVAKPSNDSISSKVWLRKALRIVIMNRNLNIS